MQRRPFLRVGVHVRESKSGNLTPAAGSARRLMNSATRISIWKETSSLQHVVLALVQEFPESTLNRISQAIRTAEASGVWGADDVLSFSRRYLLGPAQ